MCMENSPSTQNDIDPFKIQDSEEEIEDTLTPNPVRAIAVVPRSPVKMKVISTKRATSVAISLGTERATSSRKPSSTVSTATTFSHVSSERDLFPEFMKSAWNTVFLPTLYHRLGCSEKPFEDWCKGPDIVKNVQSVISLVWSGTDYQVKFRDEACDKVSIAILIGKMNLLTFYCRLWTV